MSAVNDILSQIPIQQLASQLGTDEQTAQAAVEQAVPLLISGLRQNALEPEGERALAGALDDHAARGLLDGGVDLNQVDTLDGEKIVHHVFGGQQDQVINQLAGAPQLGGLSSGLIQRLLPLLAPIVLAYLGRQLQGRGRQQGGHQPQAPAGGGILGDLLGGLLGAGAMGGAMGGLGDMLGGGKTEQQRQYEQHAEQSVPTQQGFPSGQTFPTQQPGSGELRMDPGDGAGPDAQTPQAEQQSGGGILDALKDMFGGNKR